MSRGRPGCMIIVCDCSEVGRASSEDGRERVEMSVGNLRICMTAISGKGYASYHGEHLRKNIMFEIWKIRRLQDSTGQI